MVAGGIGCYQVSPHPLTRWAGSRGQRQLRRYLLPTTFLQRSRCRLSHRLPDRLRRSLQPLWPRLNVPIKRHLHRGVAHQGQALLGRGAAFHEQGCEGDTKRVEVDLAEAR